MCNLEHLTCSAGSGEELRSGGEAHVQHWLQNFPTKSEQVTWPLYSPTYSYRIAILVISLCTIVALNDVTKSLFLYQL